jgi:hypothetical protein
MQPIRGMQKLSLFLIASSVFSVSLDCLLSESCVDNRLAVAACLVMEVTVTQLVNVRLMVNIVNKRLR